MAASCPTAVRPAGMLGWDAQRHVAHPTHTLPCLWRRWTVPGFMAGATLTIDSCGTTVGSDDPFVTVMTRLSSGGSYTCGGSMNSDNAPNCGVKGFKVTLTIPSGGDVLIAVSPKEAWPATPCRFQLSVAATGAPPAPPPPSPRPPSPPNPPPRPPRPPPVANPLGTLNTPWIINSLPFLSDQLDVSGGAGSGGCKRWGALEEERCAAAQWEQVLSGLSS